MENPFSKAPSSSTTSANPQALYTIHDAFDNLESPEKTFLSNPSN